MGPVNNLFKADVEVITAGIAKIQFLNFLKLIGVGQNLTNIFNSILLWNGFNVNVPENSANHPYLISWLFTSCEWPYRT